ncbi:meteorin-like protein [Macrobrachium nipponense]|uniref:meteorin-like protein n=1 Tax=Macrobrachium nipponense TaxID=159736 RepID=UPI0030C8510D
MEDEIVSRMLVGGLAGGGGSEGHLSSSTSRLTRGRRRGWPAAAAAASAEEEEEEEEEGLSSEVVPSGHHLERRNWEGMPQNPTANPPRIDLPTAKGFLRDGLSKDSFCRSTCGSGGSGNRVVWGLRWPLPLRTLWVCFLWVLFTTPTNTCADSNGCDFYGSGLEQDGRGVQPVYLSCSSGRVEWQYPRAGLRVILKSPHKDKEFHACIKADKKFGGARVYLEGHRSLLPLYAPDDGRPTELLRCFTSYKGQAALYVEADQGADDLKKQVAAFEYDLQSLAKGALYDPIEECRPCSEEELLRLYCSADFVAKGTIVASEDDSRLKHTKITVRATKLFQQTSPVFRHSASSRKGKKHQSSYYSHRASREALFLQEEEVESNALVPDVAEGYVGHVSVPIECGARAGEGEFLVMGVVRLGQPMLKCAPRHAEWVTLSKTAHARAQCVIET